MKSMLSRLAAGILLLLFSPVILIAGLLINLYSKGSLFYKQIREGKNGTQFYIWKLRTMVPDADKKLALMLKQDQKLVEEWQEFGCLRNDPRIAGAPGRLARQYSVDELPQLWNICNGTMVFVGPRPLELHLANSIDPKMRAYRNSVYPGVTGLWQIGPRSEINIRQMQHYDKLYIKKKKFLLDVYIVIKTLKVIFKRTGR